MKLQTMMYGCFQDEAGRNASLKTVNCAIKLTCIKPDGSMGGSQTLQYTYGGYSPGNMQTASINTNTFKCCKTIKFSTTPAAKVDPKYTVATAFDTISMYVSSTKSLSASYLSPQAVTECGC